MFRKLLPWLGVILLSFFSFKSLLKPGYFPMHDDMQAMRVLQMDKCFRDGQIPCRWVPDMGFGYGYPQFLYYSPLPYYLMEAVHLSGFSVLDSVKIGFALSFVASGLSMFLLGQALWGSWGGLVSAIFYVYAPYRVSDVYTRGAVGEFWAMAFLPLIFWAILKLVKKEQFRSVAFLALACGGLMLTHNITTLAFTPLAALWGLFLLWRERKWRLLPRLVLGGFWGFALAGFFILPVVLEKRFVHVETMTMGYFNYLAHFLSLRQLFFSGHWGYGSSELGQFDDLSFSLGLWHWLLAAIVVAASALYKQRKHLLTVGFIFLLALGVIFMTHQRSVFIWNLLPFLKYFQFPWRFLSPATFLLSLLAGGILLFIDSRRTKVFISLILVLVVIVFNSFYCRPRLWYEISDQDKFSGELWEKQLTISIFDYLPIYAASPPAQKAPEGPEVIEGEAQINAFKKGTDWQEGEVTVFKEARIQLPLYYFPGFTLYLNGRKAALDRSSSLGLISFKAPVGDHQFRVKLERTPVRWMGDLLSLGALLALGGYGIYAKKNN
jgi:hypothetical protein